MFSFGDGDFDVDTYVNDASEKYNVSEQVAPRLRRCPHSHAHRRACESFCRVCIVGVYVLVGRHEEQHHTRRDVPIQSGGGAPCVVEASFRESDSASMSMD